MIQFILSLAEILLLVTALSVDTFVASFAYGANRIRVPFRSMAVLSGVTSIVLAVSLLLGSLIRPVLPPGFARGLCVTLLIGLGIVKLFDSSIKACIRRNRMMHKKISVSALHLRFILTIYADPEQADADLSHTLSPAEATALAFALSIDGLAVGFGAAFSGIAPLPTAALSFLTGLAAVALGRVAGEKIASILPLDLSWLSGALLILLAVLKL